MIHFLPLKSPLEPGYNQVQHEQIVAEEMTQDMLGNSAIQDQVIDQDVPEVVERIQEPPVLVRAPMIETAPVVAEDVQSAQETTSQTRSSPKRWCRLIQPSHNILGTSKQ